jgi:hypothetical protein
LRRDWTGRNVNLKKLIDRLSDFLKEKDFEAVRGEKENGFQFFAQNSSFYKFNGYFTITIEGKPEEFFVELELSDKAKKAHLYPVMSTTLLGGGYFLLRSLKAREEWSRFERDFWEYTDRVIDYLSHSSN